MNFYYWLISTLSFGYSCLIPSLIIAWMIFKKHRERIMQFVAIANGWFCVYAVLFISYLAFELFDIWYEQYRYEGYDYSHSKMNLFSPYGFAYWLQFVTIPLALLFIWKRFRRSLLLSTILLIIHIIPYEKLIIYISSRFSDYLPSKWRTEPKDWWEFNLFYLLYYLVIIAATYYWQKKRRLAINS